MLHSSSSSGIFFQGDMQNLQLGSFGNMSNPVNMHPNVAHVTPVSSDINNNAMNSASSIVTDANSGLSGGISGLPTSPLSFSSNNLGSCIIDGPSTVNQVRVHDNVSHLQKKPRLDTKQDDNIIQQQAVQQILQRQDTMQLQNPNPQLQALIQQQRLRQQQQQQILQSLPPMQRAHLLQQQQLRQLQQQGVQPGNAVKRPYDGGVCSRRLMQYLYHQRQRPADNSIAYWRKFVAEYYSPRAKQRWCLSLYDNVGHHSLGVFPQAAVDSWQCDICGSKSGKGFEATFEVLPRLNEIKFSSGVIDELLFLDLPRESRFPSGVMMLEYGKAVQESVYEQLRVVRQGQLKVIFTPDLKILTWEFCARRHEELLPRRLIAPQVNQLLQVAQKCQATIAEGGSNGVSQQDLQTNSNMVVTAWRQLARSLELQSLNDLGFSKRYVRCLQISEVVSSMKDLMDFCHETKVGPIEGLKSFPRQMSNDRNALNKLAGLHPGHQMGGGNNGLTLTNYQNMLMRQKSMNNSVAQVNTHLLHHQQQPPPSQGGGGSQVAQQQQHMIQQLIQNMNSNNGGGGGGGAGPSRSNSFKGGGASHSDSSAGGGGGGQKAAVVSQEMGSEFPENGFFNDDFEDTMGYGWKE